MRISLKLYIQVKKYTSILNNINILIKSCPAWQNPAYLEKTVFNQKRKPEKTLPPIK